MNPCCLQDVKVIRKRKFMRMPNTIAVSAERALGHWIGGAWVALSTVGDLGVRDGSGVESSWFGE